MTDLKTALTCTWYIEPKTIHSTENKKKVEKVVPGHECGKKATCTYSKLNPQRRRPDAPRMLVHPRCGTHDTNAAQREAPSQGYERIEI